MTNEKRFVWTKHNARYVHLYRDGEGTIRTLCGAYRSASPQTQTTNEVEIPEGLLMCWPCSVKWARLPKTP